jgi:hypothetical protein
VTALFNSENSLTVWCCCCFLSKPVKISHISVIQFKAWLDTQMPSFDIHLFLFSRTQTAEIKHATSLHFTHFVSEWQELQLQSSANVSPDLALPLHSTEILFYLQYSHTAASL